MTSAHQDLIDPSSWVGRSTTTDDQITAFPLNALAGLLDRERCPAVAGTPIPPLWHWVYFLPTYRADELRKDGHLRGGELMPPIPLPRRVWAGSKFTWNAENPLRVGDKATRVSRVDSITPKEGKSGQLVFVKVVHEFRNAAGNCLINEHLTAFRGPPRHEASPPPVPRADTASTWHRELIPDPVLLFRYSALTFNAHRIHYDWPYTTREEGYPNLLVQGPLMATLLAELINTYMPEATLQSLDFKVMHPSFVERTMHLRGQPHGNNIRLWASDDDGRLTMTAAATVS